jgi:hypothetical protein
MKPFYNSSFRGGEELEGGGNSSSTWLTRSASKALKIALRTYILFYAIDGLLER